MSHWRRTILVTIGLASVVVLMLFLNTVGAEMFAIAYDLEFVKNGPFYANLKQLETIAYSLIVPIFLIVLLAWQLFGPVQDERERDLVRRRP